MDRRVTAARGRPSWATSPLTLAGLLVALFALPSIGSAQQAPADTVVADTTPTTLERALQRLRALPRSPVQPDPADTVAADSIPADTLVTALPRNLPVLEPPAVEQDTGAVIIVDSTGEHTPRLRGRPVRDPGAAGREGVAGVPVQPQGERPGPPGGVRPADRVAPDAVTLAVPADSVLPILRALEGYAITEYSGEAAVFHADSNRLRLLGTSAVGQGTRTLTTDSLLVYDGETGIVCGYGAPVLSGEQEPIQSRRVCYAIERNLGVAVGARTKVAEGATWYVQGADNRVYLLTGGSQNTIYGEDAEFTSCELPEPHYTFRAETLKAVDGGMMIARDVTLRFADVPVFWLPWMVQSTKRGRRSGLLMPQFGVNDIVRTGGNRHISNVGYYWAINDYMSTQGTFEWYSSNYTAVEGALAYRWLRQFLNGRVFLKRYWRENGQTELTLNTSNSWQPDERTNLNASGAFATSTDFVKRQSFDPRELNRSITFSASANRRFDWGSVTAGYQRQQRLTDERIQQSFPSLNVSFSPMTLYTSADAATQLTWNGSGRFEHSSVNVLDTIPGERDRTARNASFQHQLRFGRLSLSQGITWDEDVHMFKAVPGFEPPDLPLAPPYDSLLPAPDLPEQTVEAMQWNTSLSYQQNLWTGTTLSPSINLSQERLRDTEHADRLVAAPMRISAGASLATTVFGFWPGVGPFSRIRHKVSPSLSWSYSPSPGETSVLQDSLFGVSDLRAQHRLSLSINQTFEAKYEGSDTAMVAADTAGSADGEPRRLPQAETITLLAINTSPAFVYDFVARQEGDFGFRTTSISNALRSDLLRGFQLSTTHDLFRGDGQTTTGVSVGEREFDPFLTSLSARFSIDEQFWLFRFLGLTRSELSADTMAAVEQAAQGVSDSDDTGMIDAESNPSGMTGGVNSIIPGRGLPDGAEPGGVGGWNASLNYSLVRPREGERSGRENQMLRGNFSFRPTEHWSVRWSTGYSFTAGEFSDHVLTLSRDLHRWTANFDFIKAQNGNFAMQFRVHLTDNPDLKLEYDQHTDVSELGRGPSVR